MFMFYQLFQWKVWNWVQKLLLLPFYHTHKTPNSTGLWSSGGPGCSTGYLHSSKVKSEVMGIRYAVLEVDDSPKWEGYSLQLWTKALGLPGDTFQVFACHQGKFPQLSDLHNYDCLIVPGSHYSAYDDVPHIRTLASLLPAYVASPLKVVGCCFGHQMLAHSLGGRVGKNPSGR